MSRRGGGWVNRFRFSLQHNDQRVLRHMLSQGININHAFKEPGHKRQYYTPIFIAVSENYRDLAHILIKSGCDLEYTDALGETALFVAIQHGKMTMIRFLVNAGANVNHQNKKGESVLLCAIRKGQKDIVDHLLSAGADVDLQTFDGTTPLLLALELLENACTLQNATRRTAPSNIGGVISTIIPLSSNLNHQHPNRGSALRIALSIETQYFSDNLKFSKLLLQHGAIPDRLFYLRYGGLNATTSKPGSEFFTEEFFNIAYAAGANLQREKTWLLTVLTEMPQELQPFEQLFRELLQKAMSPPSLQIICLIYLRGHLRGRLWKKIEQLPLPITIQNCLKLRI